MASMLFPLVGAVSVLLAGTLSDKLGSLHGRVAVPSMVLLTVMLIQIGAGFVTVLLLAPIYMQVIHLFLADTFWLTLLIFAFEVYAVPDVSGSVLFRGALPPEKAEG